MKKLLSFFLAVCLLAAVLSGCSKSSDDTGIPAQAFSTGTVLLLPLKAELNNGDYVSYGGHQFESSKKLSKMSSLITKKNETVTAEVFKNAYGDCVLFTQENPSGVDQWCLYQADPANTKRQFIFSGLHRTLDLGGSDGNLELLLPLHLISDSQIRDSMGSRLSLGSQYACGLKDADSTMAEMFVNFYQSSGIYRVAPGADSFGLALSDPSSKLQLQFDFFQHDDSDWFSITDVTPHEPEPVNSMDISYQPSAEAEPAVVTLTGNDAITLSTLLISFPYSAGATDLEYPYTMMVDESLYHMRLIWQDNAWSGTVEKNGNTSPLTNKSASIIAAMMYHQNLIDTADTESPIPDGLQTMADCLATTGDVNVRSQPSTNGKVLYTLPQDSPVAVIGKVDNWYQIFFGGERAYMSADYLKGVN